jgi:hypothetical protein
MKRNNTDHQISKPEPPSDDVLQVEDVERALVLALAGNPDPEAKALRSKFQFREMRRAVRRGKR